MLDAGYYASNHHSSRCGGLDVKVERSFRMKRVKPRRIDNSIAGTTFRLWFAQTLHSVQETATAGVELRLFKAIICRLAL